MQVVGGHWAGGWWTFGAAYYILWLGLMDHAFGEDNDPPPPRYRKPQQCQPETSGRWGRLLGDDGGFGVLLYGWVVAQLGLVAWGCGAVRGLTFTEQARPPADSRPPSHHQFVSAQVGFSLSVGICTGTMGLSVSHWLMHRGGTRARLAAELVLMSFHDMCAPHPASLAVSSKKLASRVEPPKQASRCRVGAGTS